MTLKMINNVKKLNRNEYLLILYVVGLYVEKWIKELSKTDDVNTTINKIIASILEKEKIYEEDESKLLTYIVMLLLEHISKIQNEKFKYFRISVSVQKLLGFVIEHSKLLDFDLFLHKDIVLNGFIQDVAEFINNCLRKKMYSIIYEKINYYIEDLKENKVILLLNLVFEKYPMLFQVYEKQIIGYLYSTKFILIKFAVNCFKSYILKCPEYFANYKQMIMSILDMNKPTIQIVIIDFFFSLIKERNVDSEYININFLLLIRKCSSINLFKHLITYFKYIFNMKLATDNFSNIFTSYFYNILIHANSDVFEIMIDFILYSKKHLRVFTIIRYSLISISCF